MKGQPEHETARLAGRVAALSMGTDLGFDAPSRKRVFYTGVIQMLRSKIRQPFLDSEVRESLAGPNSYLQSANLVNH